MVDGQTAIDWRRQKISHSKRLLELLCDLRWHDQQELTIAGGRRYGARLHEMKADGFDIVDEWCVPKSSGKRYRMRSRERLGKRQRKVRIYLDQSDAEELQRGEITLFALAAVQDGLDSFRANRGRN